MGYSIFRIPYFIQWCDLLSSTIFGYDYVEFSKVYNHGFIDNKAVLPADFCSLGVNKFYNNINVIYSDEEFVESVLSSLKSKSIILGDSRLVYPLNFEEDLEPKL
jgi:hypothetical protein